MKTVSYDFCEFIRREHLQEVKKPKMSLIPLATVPFIPSIAHAGSKDIQSKMMDAFNPLIDLVQGMAYPIASVTVLCGAIMLMVGNKDKAFTLMMNAGLGYVVVMIAPMVLDVLVQAMGSVV